MFARSESSYRDFQSALIPTVNPDRILGVRFPILRKIAAKIQKEGECDAFLSDLPHRYFEEDCIHAVLICGMKNPIPELERFLPYVDNWSVCDTLSPKAFQHPDDTLLDQVRIWLKSPHPYTVRFGMGVLMKYFLENRFSKEQLSWVCEAITDDYYVKMMAAWYYATALAKQYDHVRAVLEQKQLSAWVHNKTIQKAIESFRVPASRKEYLRCLRIK